MTERVHTSSGQRSETRRHNASQGGPAPWKIIIADDDPDVHNITRLVLDDYEFEGRPLKFLSAYSGEETKALIAAHPDTAIILLDVVMETDDSGLQVVRHIRRELENHFVRIILRTGQPGKARKKM